MTKNEIENRIDIHGKMQKELLENKSAAAFLFLIDAIALQGAKYLEEQLGAVAVPMPCDAPYEYWDCETLIGNCETSSQS